MECLHSQFRRLAHGLSLLLSIIMGIMLLVASCLMANLYAKYCHYVKHQHSYRPYYPYDDNDDYPPKCGYNEHYFLMLPLFGFITMVVWVRYL